MGGGVLVDPVLLGVGHALSPRHLACRSGLVKSAAFRAVTEGLEPVPFLGRIPVVDDHLHRHSTAPDTGRALGVIRPGVQTPMPTAAIGLQVKRHAMKRRTSREITFSIIYYLQTACLVESGRLKPRVRNGNRLPACLHTCTETVLCLRGFSDRDLELARFILDCSVCPKHISQVAVAPLIKGPHEPDAGLDGYNPPGPSNLFRARLCSHLNLLTTSLSLTAIIDILIRLIGRRRADSLLTLPFFTYGFKIRLLLVLTPALEEFWILAFGNRAGLSDFY